MSDRILSVDEAAKKWGLISLGLCTACTGYATMKYSNGLYTLSWRKFKYMFQLRRKNEVIKDWTAVKHLQEYLDSYFKSIGYVETV